MCRYLLCNVPAVFFASFGDLPENSAPLERVVTIMNTGAMEAVLVFHLMHNKGAPRGPGCHCTGPGGEQSPVGGAVENEGSVRSFKKASAATPFSPRTAAET